MTAALDQETLELIDAIEELKRASADVRLHAPGRPERRWAIDREIRAVERVRKLSRRFPPPWSD